MNDVKTPVYLDYQATTPMDADVFEAMTPYFSEKFGNPHSSGHRFGWEAEAGVNAAREHIADVIGANAEDIVFTSGATEANNLAIKGVMEAYGHKRNHLVTLATEHKCVLECAKALEKRGYTVTVLPVGRDGLADLDTVRRAVSDNTALLSVMAVNNEIGVIQDVKALSNIARDAGALFHTDAAQGWGKIPLDVDVQGIDLMSISAHKAYGPKGIGALYVRSKPRVALNPQMHGGGQERGLRSGTLSPALCAGFGKAAEIIKNIGDQEVRRINRLSAMLRGRVLMNCAGVMINGSLDARFHGNLNMSFPGLDGDLLMTKLRDLAVSSGAACASATTGPSYVLQALGLPPDLIKSSIRFGIGRFTTEDEIIFAANRISIAVTALGGLHPVQK